MHPAGFGFQSLDSGPPRRCGSVLKGNGEMAEISQTTF
jgi:hypothetical protein